LGVKVSLMTSYRSGRALNRSDLNAEYGLSLSRISRSSLARAFIRAEPALFVRILSRSYRSSYFATSRSAFASCKYRPSSENLTILILTFRVS
jgi:hypothetical protein